MKELHAAILDSAAALALEPDDLAAKLLFLMRQRFEKSIIGYEPEHGY